MSAKRLVAATTTFLFLSYPLGAFAAEAAAPEPHPTNNEDATVDEAERTAVAVSDAARGQGLAGALLGAAEQHARDARAHVIQLETGPRSLAAIALYEKHGYVRIPNFGPYVGDEFSVCMEKMLKQP